MAPNLTCTQDTDCVSIKKWNAENETIVGTYRGLAMSRLAALSLFAIAGEGPVSELAQERVKKF